jgi:hypothetical protein
MLRAFFLCLGEPLRRSHCRTMVRLGAMLLASGYPLHHLRAASHRYGGSATIPLATRHWRTRGARWRGYRHFVPLVRKYARIKYLIM